MNIDFVFAFEADLHGHAHKYTNTHTCALLLPKRIWLCSPLCVSPPAWQMHLQSKSWWIFSLISKSKPHFPSLFLVRKPFMSAISSASHRTRSLTEQWWGKNIGLDSYLNRMLSLCDEWEQHILAYMYSLHQMAKCSLLALSSSWLSFQKLCCSHILCVLHFSLSCFQFYTLIFSYSSLTSVSLCCSLPLFVLSTASLPEWQLTEEGNILIYFFPTAMNIQCKQFLCMAVKSHVCLLKGWLVWYVGLLNNSKLPWH